MKKENYDKIESEYIASAGALGSSEEAAKLRVEKFVELVEDAKAFLKREGVSEKGDLWLRDFTKRVHAAGYHSCLMFMADRGTVSLHDDDLEKLKDSFKHI